MLGADSLNLNTLERPGRLSQASKRVPANRRRKSPQLVALVPRNRDPRGLAIRVYYGKTRLIPRYSATDDPGDAFSSWEELERKP